MVDPAMDDWTVVIQTSEAPAELALAKSARLVCRAGIGHARRHAGDLAPTLSGLMRAEGIEAKQIKTIVVARGPGGYTGLRVGLASALAIHLLTRARLIAVPTLEAVAYLSPPGWRQVLVVADALRGRAFFQAFSRCDEAWLPASGLDLVVWEELPCRSLIFPAGRWAGPGLNRMLSSGLVFPDQDCGISNPRGVTVEGLLQAAKCRIGRGVTDDPEEVDILYGQPSSAEEQWKKLHPAS